jgi:hypothetical protein
MKNDTFGWSRRFFVGGAAAVTIASFYIAAVARGALQPCDYAGVEAALPSELQALIRIGNIYLNEQGKNEELDTLEEILLNETETGSDDILLAVQHRLLAIDDQIRDEFARCETVICDGWVLAKSEARLCAMIAAHVRRL